MRRVAVVAIGASAGGVQALSRIAGALPPDFAPAVLVVLHVPPDADGESFAGTLGARCALPVYVPDAGEPVRHGAIGLAPPGYHLHVEHDRALALSLDEPVRWSRPSVDVLFESTARVYRDEALAIVLSGANEDGADGARAVRTAGGLCWVQAPSDAGMPMMPRAALARAGADAVLTLESMSDALRTGCWRTRR